MPSSGPRPASCCSGPSRPGWCGGSRDGRVHCTDVANASRTLLFNITSLDWDDDLLRMLNVPRALLPRIVSSAGVVGEADADWFGSADPDRRPGWRPAGGIVRSGLLHAGPGQEHVRHRLFPAGHDRPHPAALGRWPAHDGGLGHRAGGRVRARRQRLRDRRGGAVAAGRAGRDPRRGRDRGAGQLGARQRRRLSGAGLCRAGCAALGHVRSRAG